MVLVMDSDKVISICILVVNEDHTCRNIVKEMLCSCTHQVLRTGGTLDVIHALWEIKDRLDLVLTNADKLESTGTEIFNHIQDTLLLHVTPISLDKRKIESKSQSFSFSAYVLTGCSMNDLRKLWKTALEKEKGKLVAARQENARRVSVSDIAVETNKASSSTYDAAPRKRKGIEVSEGSEEDHHHTDKKPRVVWTTEMHQKFLEAIEILGYENAVPKKIVEVMNIPGLTRENVASHLQKYRGSMKRTQETVFSPLRPTRLNSLRERFDYTSLQGLRREEDKLHQIHVPKLHFAPNYTAYIDQRRNMLLSIDKPRLPHNSRHVSKFVGYSLTSDGKSVEYGSNKASFQGQSLSGNADPMFALQTSNWDFGNESDAEKCLSFLEHNTTPLQAREEAPGGNDLFAPCPAAFLEGISEQQFSQSPLMPPQMLQCFDDLFNQIGDDDVMLKGAESMSYQFDLEDFDNTIFSSDD